MFKYNYSCVVVSILLLVVLSQYTTVDAIAVASQTTIKEGVVDTDPLKVEYEQIRKEAYNYVLRKQFPEPEAGIINKCLLNKAVLNCHTNSSGFAICPNITACLNTFSELDYKALLLYTIFIPSGSYGQRDCPGQYGNLGMNGQLVFTTIGDNNNGRAIFECGSSQFLQATLVNEVSLTFEHLELSGYSSGRGGCINILCSMAITQVSTIMFYDMSTGPSGCIANTNGGFLNTQVGVVTFINSNISNNQAIRVSGGAILAKYAFVSFINSTANNNVASQYFGGVCMCSFFKAIDSTFINNTANGGGCFFITNSALVMSSTFLNNVANTGNGGVLYVLNPLTVLSSVFLNNSAFDGGAIFGYNMTIRDTIFSHNQATGSKYAYGGAIYGSVELGVVQLNNCTFSDNYAQGQGGAVYVDTISLYSESSTFISNVATSSGGAVFSSNGANTQSIDLLASKFIDNLSYLNGGAIAMAQPLPTYPIGLILMGSNFDGNSAVQYGGGVYFENYPSMFIGGNFTNSKSSESGSMTFYSQSLLSVNTVNLNNINLPYYDVPIFNEPSFNYWKATGVKGQCINGLATISQNGYVTSCTCFPPATGPSCN